MDDALADRVALAVKTAGELWCESAGDPPAVKYHVSAGLAALAALRPGDVLPNGLVVVPATEMTNAMMDAGQRYLDDRTLRLRFVLPAKFNWHEFWVVLLVAAKEPGNE